MAGRDHFRWPNAVTSAVSLKVDEAVKALSPKRFREENAYVAALAGRLEGPVYEGRHGHVRFEATIPTSAGRGSAESRTGADLALVAILRKGNREKRKVILAQAKKGNVDNLGSSERRRLVNHDLYDYVDAPKVLEVPSDVSAGVWVRSGNKVYEGLPSRRFGLGPYLTGYVLTCIEGSTSEDLIQGVQDSRMTTLSLIASRPGETPHDNL